MSLPLGLGGTSRLLPADLPHIPTLLRRSAPEPHAQVPVRGTAFAIWNQARRAHPPHCWGRDIDAAVAFATRVLFSIGPAGSRRGPWTTWVRCPPLSTCFSQTCCQAGLGPRFVSLGFSHDWSFTCCSAVFGGALPVLRVIAHLLALTLKPYVRRVPEKKLRPRHLPQLAESFGEIMPVRVEDVPASQHFHRRQGPIPNTLGQFHHAWKAFCKESPADGLIV